MRSGVRRRGEGRGGDRRRTPGAQTGVKKSEAQTGVEIGGTNQRPQKRSSIKTLCAHRVRGLLVAFLRRQRLRHELRHLQGHHRLETDAGVHGPRFLSNRRKPGRLRLHGSRPPRGNLRSSRSGRSHRRGSCRRCGRRGRLRGRLGLRLRGGGLRRRRRSVAPRPRLNRPLRRPYPLPLRHVHGDGDENRLSVSRHGVARHAVVTGQSVGDARLHARG